MGVLIFFAFVAAVAGAWWRFTEHAKSLGKGWFLRNWISGTLATLIGLLALAFMSSGGWWPLVGAVIVFYAASSPWLRIEGNDVRWERSLWRAEEKNKAVPAPPVDPEREDVPVLASSPNEKNLRQESLAAMKRATKARELDKKARGEIDAPPLNPWSTDGAGAVCDIEFEYVDAKGKASHRHVSVEAVDKEYLEGFCHTAMATRTFVIGRVRGKILDRDNGELLTPKKWAEQVRRDPRNGTVSMGGGRSTVDYEDEDDDVETSTEVLFTGFPAARRDELEELAEMFDMTVRKSVTQGLDYLVIGPNAGPSKMEKAEAAGATVIDDAGFIELLGKV